MTEDTMPKVDHLEYASKDPGATRKFLQKVFGWKFTVMEESGYSIRGEREGAEGPSIGVREVMGPELPGSVCYAVVKDIDASIKAVESAGGKVLVPKREIPGFGWSVVYLAPGEVVQGLYQPR